MPNRILHATILTDERINSLSIEAELFFRRLMSVVDDWGRYDGRPSILRVACYPLRVSAISDEDVAAYLGELRSAGLVEIYEAGGKPFLQLVDFRQTIRAKRSKYPPPPAACTSSALHMHSTCDARAVHALHTVHSTVYRVPEPNYLPTYQVHGMVGGVVGEVEENESSRGGMGEEKRERGEGEGGGGEAWLAAMRERHPDVDVEGELAKLKRRAAAKGEVLTRRAAEAWLAMARPKTNGHRPKLRVASW